jgi:hypothetical protein
VVLLFLASFITDYFSMKKRSLHLEEEVRKVFTGNVPRCPTHCRPRAADAGQAGRVEKGCDFFERSPPIGEGDRYIE